MWVGLLLVLAHFYSAVLHTTTPSLRVTCRALNAISTLIDSLDKEGPEKATLLRSDIHWLHWIGQLKGASPIASWVLDAGERWSICNKITQSAPIYPAVNIPPVTEYP